MSQPSRTKHIHTKPTRRTALAAVFIALCVLAGACTSSDQTASDSASPTATSATTEDNVAGALFDSSIVHTISVDFDEDEYATLIEAYQTSGDKEWIAATVTIDGSTYNDVGLRLKGNSSLRSLGSQGGQGGIGGTGGEISAEEPEGLPWLIRLDKFIDHQSHEGIKDMVVRSNNSETSLNEAVALDLLAAAGLASEDAIAVRYSVNGSDERLRLVIENPDDVWMSANFEASGGLYKAESSGDYNYHGDDPKDYDEIFDQEAGKDNTDLTPLIEFMDFINNSDDGVFASELGDQLDIESFATYLAMQEIVDNFDDIDGPGNNSYLYFDTETEQFTVVPWDYNLAFGAIGAGGFGGGDQGEGFGGGAGGGDRPGQGQIPDGFDPDDLPEGFDPDDLPEDGRPGGFGEGGFGGGGLGGSNTLVERFLANADFEALFDQAVIDLNKTLIESGLAESILNDWVLVLEAGASDLVDPTTISSEAESIARSLQ